MPGRGGAAVPAAAVPTGCQADPFTSDCGGCATTAERVALAMYFVLLMLQEVEKEVDDEEGAGSGRAKRGRKRKVEVLEYQYDPGMEGACLLHSLCPVQLSLHSLHRETHPPLSCCVLPSCVLCFSSPSPPSPPPRACRSHLPAGPAARLPAHGAGGAAPPGGGGCAQRCGGGVQGALECRAGGGL